MGVPAAGTVSGAGGLAVSPLAGGAAGAMAMAGAAPGTVDLTAAQAQLGGFPCSALKLKHGAGGRVLVSGSVSQAADRDAVRSLLAHMLPGQTLVSDIAVVGPPLCKVLVALAPLRDRNEAAGGRLAIRLEKGENRLIEDEKLVVSVAGGDSASYIQILYFTLDGAVLRVLPNTEDTDDRLPARGKRIIGKPGEARKIVSITSPFGQELIAVIASPRPMLYSTRRPDTEPVTDFLAALKGALDGETGPQRSMAATVFINTQARQ